MGKEIIKIAIIHGDNQVDGKNRNGEISYINCSLEDEYFHVVLMLDYFKENFKDNEIIQKYDVYTSVNTMALQLRKLGNIVFLNTTNYRKEMLEKHGRHGVIMMPDVITNEQVEALKELKEKLIKYNEIQIWYDITDDGQAQMILGDANIIDKFTSRKIR